jgi:cytochrome P450
MSTSRIDVKAPGPGISAMPHTLEEFPRSPIAFCTDLFKEYGDIVRFRIGPYLVHLIANPDFIQHVLQDNNDNYVKGRSYVAFEPIIGNGLLTSEGEFWRRQRRLANPSFHRDKLNGFVSMFAEQAGSMLDEWEACARNQEVIDVSKEMMRLTFGVVGRALFSLDLEKDAREVGDAITVALAEASRRADLMIPMPLWLPTQSNQQYAQARQTLDAFVADLIRERRKMKDRPFDLLTLLIEAVDDDTQERMTDQQLRDEVMTFLLAGHETTAVSLTWTWYVLSEHPEAEDKVRAECRQIIGEASPEIESLSRLVYTKMVFDEALRLYPPFPFIARNALEPDQIGGYEIPANSMVLLSQYLMHHHPGYWDDPDVFRPERFTPQAIHDRPHMSYFPFGGGQRMCIGADFATMEALTFLSLAIQRYHLKRASRQPVELLERVTLRPKGGMPMFVENL